MDPRAFERIPDPAWEEKLEELTPRSDRLSYLTVRWHPGSMRAAREFQGVTKRRAEWVPVERWLIYNVVPDPTKYPPMLFAPFRLSELNTEGFCRPVLDLDRRAMDSAQWAIYKETGRYAQPFWVVQGHRGGHKRNYTQVESRVSILNGGPGDPPDMGALPYAEPDERTWEKLATLDLARMWTSSLALYDRKPDLFDQLEADAMKDYRRLLWDWMDEKAYESCSGVADMNAWRGLLTQAPAKRSGFKDTTDYEAEEKDFIETPA